MRPVVKSVRTDAITGTPLEIKPWGDAKPNLIIELGSHCSFCEKSGTRSAFHVEHIHGKGCLNATGIKIYDAMKYRWDNFLIACVNCNSVKGDKDVVLHAPFLPHTNNLLHYIKVLKGGLIRIRLGITGNDLIRTQAFIDLIGLDRVPGHPQFSSKDDRWDERLEAYDIAERYHRKYTSLPPETDIETIVTLAKSTGFFSAWYEIFKGQNSVIDALINGYTPAGGVLINAFPATHQASFDSTANYITRPRP
jgi:hypothetical protein